MIPRVLTIAGSDSGGGAGVQADLKTFAVLRVFGMSALTALTAQNTRGVLDVFPVPAEFVRRQIDAVVEDIGVDAAKTGMLANATIVRAVCSAVRDHGIERLVVDPVMVAQSGAALLEPEAVAVLKSELLPLAAVVTPNAAEAAALLEMPVGDLPAMHEAARRLMAAGARAVLVKGGHVPGSDAVDVLYDGRRRYELRVPRVETRHAHGTGCVTAAALAVGLAEGRELLDAAVRAKRLLTVALTCALAIGRGDGPVNPLAWLDWESSSRDPEVRCL